MTKTDFAAKIHGTVQLLIGKKASHLANCYIAFPLNSSILSKQLFNTVSDFGALKKVETWHLWFNFSHPTQTKFKFPQKGGWVHPEFGNPTAVRCLKVNGYDKWRGHYCSKPLHGKPAGRGPETARLFNINNKVYWQIPFTKLARWSKEQSGKLLAEWPGLSLEKNERIWKFSEAVLQATKFLVIHVV